MTLHAFDKSTNKSLRAVDVPLQFVDWMAANFDGKFIHYLASVDPYGDVLIPETVIGWAGTELATVRKGLRSPVGADVPNVVEVHGTYGVSGAIATIDGLVALFEFAAQNDCKIVSIGD